MRVMKTRNNNNNKRGLYYEIFGNISEINWANELMQRSLLKLLSKIRSSHRRPATLLEKWLWHRCFPMNFVKFWRTSFSTHCVKSVQIWSFFWSLFSHIRTRKYSIFGHFSRLTIASGRLLSKSREPVKELRIYKTAKNQLET